eukprot:COSAG06_NODE_17115_length_960_cov_1.250871_2_plen_238_part_01
MVIIDDEQLLKTAALLREGHEYYKEKLPDQDLDLATLRKIVAHTLMDHVLDCSFDLAMSDGSIHLSVKGLSQWAASALASTILEGEDFFLLLCSSMNAAFDNIQTSDPTVLLGGEAVCLRTPRKKFNAALQPADKPYNRFEFDVTTHSAEELEHVNQLYQHYWAVTDRVLEAHNIRCPRLAREDLKRREEFRIVVDDDATRMQDLVMKIDAELNVWMQTGDTGPSDSDAAFIKAELQR